MTTNEDTIYDELPEVDWDKREPKRSRMQIDISKDIRVRLKRYGTPKEVVIRALADKYPEIADELRQEIKVVRKKRDGKRLWYNEANGNQTEISSRRRSRVSGSD